jgi:hypothetical protein
VDTSPCSIILKIQTNFHQKCVAIEVNAMEKISVKEKYAKVSKPNNYSSKNWNMINIS